MVPRNININIWFYLLPGTVFRNSIAGGVLYTAVVIYLYRYAFACYIRHVVCTATATKYS